MVDKRIAPNLQDEAEALQFYLEALFRHPDNPTGSSLEAPTEAPVSPPLTQNTLPATQSDTDQKPDLLMCVMLKVPGGRIALRVTDIDGFVPWSGKATRLPNTPPLQLGLFPFRGTNVVVVNAGAWLFRNSGTTAATEGRDLHGKQLAVIGKARLALLCDGAGEVVKVKPDDVVWSQQRERRPWVEGFLRKSLCMLINCEALIEALLGLAADAKHTASA